MDLGVAGKCRPRSQNTVAGGEPPAGTGAGMPAPVGFSEQMVGWRARSYERPQPRETDLVQPFGNQWAGRQGNSVADKTTSLMVSKKPKSLLIMAWSRGMSSK